MSNIVIPVPLPIRDGNRALEKAKADAATQASQQGLELTGAWSFALAGNQINFTFPTKTVSTGGSGSQGPRGPGISAAIGAPSAPGQAGDLYVDTSNGDLYQFTV